MKIEIDATKRGYPAMWESGGGLTSGGSATIITGRNGEARRPIYQPRGGHLACGNHALIGVGNGFHVVTASVRRGSRDSASIKRIVSTSVKDINGERFEATAEVETLNTFSKGEWDSPLDSKFESAVEAAFRKASSYHCRSAYYVDSSARPERSVDEKRRNDERARRQDAERAKLRKAKADADAKAKADAESASKMAKEAGLGARLQEVNIRLEALGGRELVQLGEVSFRWGWQKQYYSEQAVENVERSVERAEQEKAEQERKRFVREAFQPKFEAFKPRIEALGLNVEFTNDSVRFAGDYYGQQYSDDGVLKFVADLDQRERKTAEAKAKAEAEIAYQKRKTEAMALGLPGDIRIWCRTGGRTNGGNGWVIGTNGAEREPTSRYNSNPRRLQRYGEGYKIWEQILEGEIVLRWSKSCTNAPHKFEVVHLPDEVTEAQLERIMEIQDELEHKWEGARSMSSGDPSPSVGNGWGLRKKSKPASKPVQPDQKLNSLELIDGMAALKAKFGK